MTLERTLQVTLATLLTLGTLLLGIGQANLLLPLLAAIAAGVVNAVSAWQSFALAKAYPEKAAAKKPFTIVALSSL